MDENTAEDRRKSYQETFQRHDGGIKSLQWNSYTSATKRYKAITSKLEFENKTILDIGCGFGDIIPFINSKADTFTYKGVDITDEFLDSAKKRYPDERYSFQKYDFSQNIAELGKFDIVIASGIFNTAFYTDDSSIENFITEIFTNNANKFFAFNLTGSLDEKFLKENTSSKIVYRDPIKFLKFCSTLTSNISFDHSYKKSDFTIILGK